MSPPTRRRRPRQGRLHLVRSASQRQIEDTPKLYRCADVALATGDVAVAWIDGVQLAFVPDVFEALAAEYGHLPATWQLCRNDGRYVRVYRWPGEAS